MTKPDGGPAFPIYTLQCDNRGHLTNVATYLNGMTLRDYFAGQALAGLLANPTLDVTNKSGDGESDSDIIAKACFYFADAMLAEREKD